MDWLKLFTLLVAVASISVKADGPKKKIRIHLPQKVKHIHHHKKIYITNHPATSQYAPAYMSSAEGTLAVGTNGLPAMANIVPLKSVDIYDNAQPRLPTVSSAASQLLPLYHARGYYGPTPADIEETDYDTALEPNDYISQAFSSPTITHSSRVPKRVKIIKLNEQPRKKIIRKVKPKRVVIRNKPHSPSDNEHPVSTFHEHFYSDIDGSSTIKKIRKPPRVEKIVDGDTEHIHTYSEEHIHKVFLDNAPKIGGVIGVDHFNGIPTISGTQGIIPLKGTQTLLAIPSHTFGSLTAVGSSANPVGSEYTAYNPREVTHDHIFHDHGEIPEDIELNKDTLGLPPKASYNSHGLRISGSEKRYKSHQKGKKLSKPILSDLSYYESIYSPNSRPNKADKPSVNLPAFETIDEENFDDYKSYSDFGYKETYKKPHNPIATYYGKTSNDYRLQQVGSQSPFSISSTVVHDYKPKRYLGVASASTNSNKIRHPYDHFKDSYANNFDYDTYASLSNIYTSEDKNDVGYTSQIKKGKKKSISTQNISFGGQDHVTYVDHMEDERFIDDGPTALENDDRFDQLISDSLKPDSNTIKESSPAHQYYSLMATKALYGDQLTVPESSNDNFQYAEAPTAPTTEYASVATTAIQSSNHYSYQTTEMPHSNSAKYKFDLKSSHKNKNSTQHNRGSVLMKTKDRYRLNNMETTGSDYRGKAIQNQDTSRLRDLGSPTERVNLKYGDKI